MLSKLRIYGQVMAFGFLLTSSCKKEEVSLPTEDQRVVIALPAHFPAFKDDVYNPLTKAGVALGRMLFYDPRLSENNKISCASCHRQNLAFSDGIALNNIGMSGNTLHRNAPALINLAWTNNGLFWDGGSTNLESQAFAPLASADEMHQNLDELVNELSAIPAYVVQFKQAFGTSITSGNIVKAIAQFERTLISASSKYDQYRSNPSQLTLTDQELKGLNLINKHCRNCHAGELFTDNLYHNNGLNSDFSNDEHEGIFQGRSRVSLDPYDLGKFKTPTLRNVLLTAPYMHDGRLKTIDDVILHYSNGVKLSPSLDPSLRQSDLSTGLKLTSDEREAIKASLSTLTDPTFIENPAFRDPTKGNK